MDADPHCVRSTPGPKHQNRLRPTTHSALTSLLLAAHGNTINKSHPRVDVFQQVLARNGTDVTAVNVIASVAVLFLAWLEMDVDVRHVSGFVKDGGRKGQAGLNKEKRAAHDSAPVIFSEGHGVLKAGVTVFFIASRGQQSLIDYQPIKCGSDQRHVPVQRFKRDRFTERGLGLL